jgi:hypothetical protein
MINHKFLLKISFIFIISSCANPKSLTPVCDAHYAKQLCAKQLARSKFRYDVVVKQSLNLIVLEYTPRRKNIRGGGAIFIFDKTACKIIETKRFQ